MIGKMKDRLHFYFLKKVDNGRGGWTTTEEDRGEFWGYIESLSARNIIQYRQADLNTNTKAIIRANSLINKDCCFYARGFKYAIEEIIEEDGFYQIMAVGERIAD
jgi:SPP1 family predicted phage head-tail adaptor